MILATIGNTNNVQNVFYWHFRFFTIWQLIFVFGPEYTEGLPGTIYLTFIISDECYTTL